MMMPKTSHKLIGLLCCTILLVNCKKEYCTDENALNFDPKANINDFSCTFAGDPYIGTYEITDTLYMPMLSEISTVYQKVTIIGTNSDTLYLADYRNTDFDLVLIMDGDAFEVPEQEIWSSQVISGNGMFQNDSLFYLIGGTDYDNRGNGAKF
tara:strand:+ start:81 stop:539 length:459 start_codon:yes stop_codon:yes gene_type:complete